MGVGVEAFTAGRDGTLPFPVVQPKQTHSVNVAYVESSDISREMLEGVDALVTDRPGVAIGVRTADCIPVLLYDPVRKVIAAAHSGWRGTVNMISKKTVLEMSRRFHCQAADIRAVIGPGIGFDSFQVGEEVALAFKESGFPVEKIWDFRGAVTEGSMAGGHHINLPECVRYSLLDCGLKEENITVLDIDTYTDERFYSARREGAACGRNINAIRLL